MPSRISMYEKIPIEGEVWVSTDNSEPIEPEMENIEGACSQLGVLRFPFRRKEKKERRISIRSQAVKVLKLLLVEM